MTLVKHNPAINEFEKQLRTLCLNEFPCGIGSWRKSPKKQGKKSDQQLLDKVSSQFSVTLKDYGPQSIKTETLEQYIKDKRSPWSLDYTWSDEAQALRRLAAQSPWLIDEQFVFDHFKTLRIVDKNVTTVDEQFKCFSNLEELTLSANHLCTINSRYLPRSLKVLELCANELSDLEDLCDSPPPLMHLGLGYNRITGLQDYITGEYWPNLLSLDLSHNSLCDLIDIVRKLSALPNLKNLILQGNPLSLIPGYRGYTIDSLRALNYLDDVTISADEKHHFKGLARRREFVLDEAKVRLEVKYMKGLPMPEEMKNADEQPEYPKITRKFFVEFMYADEKSSKVEIFQILHDELVSSQSQNPESDGKTQDGLSTTRDDLVSMDKKSVQSIQDMEKSVIFADETETIENACLDEGEIDQNQADFERNSRADDFQSELGSPQPTDSVNKEDDVKFRVAPILSELCLWEEEVELNWSKLVTRYDLLALRDFFREGMDISIKEEKVLSYPADQFSEKAPSSASSKKGGKEKAADKGKGGKDVKDEKKPEDKKKKKKGEPEVELVQMPPEVRTLAAFKIPLDDFLEGEYEFETIFIQGDEDSTGTPTPRVITNKKAGKKDKKDKKPGSAGKKKDVKEKETKKSPEGKKDKKDTKGKGKNQAPPGGENEEALPPPPLEVSIAVKLHHWETALDSLKDEEELKIKLDEAPVPVET